MVSTPFWLRAGIATWLATRFAIAGILAGSHLIATYTGRTVSLDRWDTSSYIAIAGHGYESATSPNFFPLLPLLEAGIGRVLAGGGVPSDAELLAAGLVVSAVASLVAFCALARLIEYEAEAPTAATAVRLLAAYPFAMFLGVAYTDAAFLAAAVLFFLFVRTRRWPAAAAAGLVAGLLRPVGPLLAVALLAELAVEIGSRRTEHATVRGRVFASLGPLVGTGLYSAFLWWRFGDPLLFVHTQSRFWHHVLMWPWQTLGIGIERLSHPGVLSVLDLGIVIVFAVLTIASLARMRVAYGVFTAGLLLAMLISPVPSHKDVIQSAGRYLLAAFPAFWIAAHWIAGRPWLEFALLAAGFPLQATLAVLFVIGGPIY
ncbi:MAG TPA: hypothetical protein VFL29_02090 [Candidatus Dormibacteraeota bacterium]|nr:hypothetical protein [Candidatus Dormibacteraeota bacterium]